MNNLQSGDIGFVFKKTGFFGLRETENPGVDFAFIYVGVNTFAFVEKGKLIPGGMATLTKRKVVVKRRSELSNEDRSNLLWYVQSFLVNKKKTPDNTNFIVDVFEYVSKPLFPENEAPETLEDIFETSKVLFEVK